MCTSKIMTIVHKDTSPISKCGRTKRKVSHDIHYMQHPSFFKREITIQCCFLGGAK